MKAKLTERKTGGRKLRRAGILAFLLVGILILPSLQAWAGGAVDPKKSCSMQIKVSSEEDYSDLKETEITAKLYRIAEINRSGAYTALEGYADLQANLDAIGADSKASDWEAIAQLAQADAASQSADVTVTVTNGQGSAPDLAAGLYLVLADPVQTMAYTYEFSCGLVSAPENTFYSIGELPDEWVYDGIAVTLKPIQTPLAGEVLITKTWRSYNPALGTPICVFDVEAYSGDAVVYSNVVSLTFDGAGTKSVTIEGLPVGARVEITEVYSGASYTTTSSQKVTIEELTTDTAEADFTNDYADRLVYGSGVVNHFSYDGNGYSWSQQTDNSGTVNGIGQ